MVLNHAQKSNMNRWGCKVAGFCPDLAKITKSANPPSVGQVCKLDQLSPQRSPTVSEAQLRENGSVAKSGA